MNLVFDLGGVVVRWQPQDVARELFADPRQQEAAVVAMAHEHWLALDRGSVEPGPAARRLAAATGLATSQMRTLIDAVPQLLIPDAGMLEFLQRLKQAGHRLYILSNMHRLSWDYLSRQFDFWNVFEHAVISSQVGMIKPEPGIYEYLLSRCQLDPADTVFIDDLPVNLAPAAALGMHILRFEGVACCERQLEALIGQVRDVA